MSNDTAATIGARMARACDNCLLKRAHWFCAADNVFLCQSCDKSVHSSPKHRHERVRLKSSMSFSIPKPSIRDQDGSTGPTWQHAITRKARTPRTRNKGGGDGEEMQRKICPVVPDLDVCEEAEDLIFRVPVFNPVLHDQPFSHLHQEQDGMYDLKLASTIPITKRFIDKDEEGLMSDLDVADFDMDMDRLFGYEPQSVYYHMGDWENNCSDEAIASMSAFMESSGSVKEEELEETLVAKNNNTDMMLKLDYNAIIHDWSTQCLSSPWMSGTRPSVSEQENMELKACIEQGDVKMKTVKEEEQQHTFTVPKYTDFHREAKVSRYRQKRRKRLFAKKIRYEVRKLNAEKRPRIKGRFVKRSLTNLIL